MSSHEESDKNQILGQMIAAIIILLTSTFRKVTKEKKIEKMIVDTSLPKRGLQWD